MTHIRRDAPHGGTSASARRLWLEVERGSTSYPRRPLTSERTLIGCGSTCQLQLGGDGIPMVHSLIIQHLSDVTIEAFCAEPPLLINGTPCRHASLEPGDSIGIGPFRFTLRVETAHSPETRQHRRRGPRASSEEEESDSDVAGLSIVALVDQLESDLRMVEDFDTGRRRGLARLLKAARAQSDSKPAVAAPTLLRLADYRPDPSVADDDEQRHAA